MFLDFTHVQVAVIALVLTLGSHECHLPTNPVVAPSCFLQDTFSCASLFKIDSKGTARICKDKEMHKRMTRTTWTHREYIFPLSLHIQVVALPQDSAI